MQPSNSLVFGYLWFVRAKVAGRYFILIPFFYALNLLLLLSGLLRIRLDSGMRLFSLALVQTLLGLPLLAGEYLYLAYHLKAQAVQVVLFSEIVFALIWLSMALRLRSATLATVRESRLNFLIEIIVGAVVTAAAGYFLVYRSVTEISDAILAFHHYSPIYCWTKPLRGGKKIKNSV